MALNTKINSLFQIEHPIVLGGMAGATSPNLVAAVSNAGGLGIQGVSFRTPSQIQQFADEIRHLTDRPFGFNVLLFGVDDETIDAVLATRPSVFSTAWGFPEQDLKSLFNRAHDVGAKVIHMVSTVPEAIRAVEAGADAIVAQGTEGGGHVGILSSMTFIPQVVKAVGSIPVLAAGGIADGAGIASALMLGAEGALLGTRFLATPEAPLPESFKQRIVKSDGSNTLLTEIPDIVNGRVWPGAYARVERNRLIEDWIGREVELRYHRQDVEKRTKLAREQGDPDYSVLYMGENVGLINDIVPTSELMGRLVEEAEQTLRNRTNSVLGNLVVKYRK
jgi:NAD(P)H-dependent flavin oxidoreductase YrpB (nitropropane dioxygenase family)